MDGFLTEGDTRLEALGDALGERVNRTVLLGGYAKPLTAEELEPNAPVPESPQEPAQEEEMVHRNRTADNGAPSAEKRG